MNRVWGGMSAAIAMLMPMRLAAEVSPLAVVMSGRAEAQNSMLTEAGITSLSISAANVIMYLCGALGIGLVAYGLFYLWDSQRMSADSRPKSPGRAILMIVVGGLLTIPAIMAAIAPHAVLAAS